MQAFSEVVSDLEGVHSHILDASVVERKGLPDAGPRAGCQVHYLDFDV